MSDSKVKWHKYPEEKPDRESRCFVTVKHGKSRYVEVTTYYLDDKQFDDFYDSQVIAWAYAEPYCDNDRNWNAYPKNIPIESNYYFVTFEGPFGISTEIFWWQLEKLKFDMFDKSVMAWSELPEPYKEEK